MISAAVVALAFSPLNQGQVVVPTFLYQTGRKIEEQKISVKGFGSGTIAETDEAAFEGTTSIRVSTRNYFQGGTMTLAEPKDLTEKYSDKANLLRFVFLLSDHALILQANAGKASIGLTAENPGAGGGATGFGQKKIVNLDPGSLPPLITKVDSLRIIVTTTDNKKSEIYVPVNRSSAVDRVGWRALAVPLHAIRGFDQTNKIIKDITFSADTVTTFYIGEIRVVNDVTPIVGEVNVDKLNLALGDEVELKARGYGGASVLVYEWDFDEADGIQVDMEGPVVRRKFRKPGDFKVTLTIADRYGLKEPWRTSFPVKVNP